MLIGEIQRHDADERFHYPCAEIAANAPLALIQLEMEARVRLAQMVLDLMGYKGSEMKVKPGPARGAKP